jgi:alpha-L-rhamnosidase
MTKTMPLTKPPADYAVPIDHAPFHHPRILRDWPSDAFPPLYPYLHGGDWQSGDFSLSPDPLRGYAWDSSFLQNPREPLQCYAALPVAATVEEGQIGGLDSLSRPGSVLTLTGSCCLRVDFGVEAAAWLEFESNDLQGDVTLSVSEYNRPGVVNLGPQSPRKTAVPVRVGQHTWRLRLNDLHYEGVRFGWIHVTSCAKPWHLRNLRAVCQIKPANYRGSFSSSHPLFDRIWETGAYAVKLNLLEDHFGSILMDRGDRHSWTGDALVTQAVSLAAFGNFDFVRQNTERMQDDDNGIETYALHWIRLLVDYVIHSGDGLCWARQLPRVAAKLGRAATIAQQHDFRGYPAFCGHDDRLGAFLEDTPPANLRYYRYLARRAARDVLGLLDFFPTREDGPAARRAAEELIVTIDRLQTADTDEPGLHDGTEALLSGALADPRRREALAERIYRDPIRAVSYSPFNGHFVLEGMAATGRWGEAGALLDRCWGGMLRLGATTFWESFRPEWSECLKPNDPIFCGTQGFTSLCHPWSSGPTRWLSDHVLGVTPTAPGFSTVQVAPSCGLVAECRGTVPTPAGEIHVERDGRSIRVLLPPGIRGTGPAGEPLAPGENVLTEPHRTLAFPVPKSDIRHEWEWLPDASPVRQLDDHWAWIAYAARPDGDETGGGLEDSGIEIIADIEGELVMPASQLGEAASRTALARREHWPEADGASALWRGALRGRGPGPCQQTVRVRILGDLSDIEEVALYFDDPGGEDLILSVDVLAEPERHLVLPVRQVRDFSGGRVLRFRPQGPCLLRICNRIDTGDPTLSGIALRKKRIPAT